MKTYPWKDTTLASAMLLEFAITWFKLSSCGRRFKILTFSFTILETTSVDLNVVNCHGDKEASVATAVTRSSLVRDPFLTRFKSSTLICATLVFFFTDGGLFVLLMYTIGEIGVLGVVT